VIAMMLRRTTSQRVLIGVVLGCVLLAVAVVLLRPRGPTDHQFAGPTELDDRELGVDVVVESVDAARQVARVRINTLAGATAVPAEGVALFTSIGSLPRIQVFPGSAVREVTADVPFATGDVVDYPFDRYGGDLIFVAVTDASTTAEQFLDRPAVPLVVRASNTAVGFSASGTITEVPTGFAPLEDLTLGMTRTPPVRHWVTAMMAIYWLVALGIVGVVLAVALRVRRWETLMLALTTSVLFALTGFRAAAPGTPPIGTFFDYASWFWAEGLVATCVVVLVVHYLATRREALGL